MGLAKVTVAALGLMGGVIAAPVEERATAAKSCDANGLCYTEWVSPESISYRFAIPSNATKAPFDVLVSITAPVKTVGWAGVAFGGAMANNPLGVGLASGKTAVLASKHSTGHTPPTDNPDATFKMLPSSMTNATHWKADALCKGCSSWGSTSLAPTNKAANLAYAMAKAVPADASKITKHDSKGKFSLDLTAAALTDFDALVTKAMAAT